MGVLDRYNERKKKRDEAASDSGTTSGGVAERYKRNQYYATLDVDSVDDNYIKTFATDTNSFFDRFSGNSLSYDEANSTLADLNTRFDTIQGWLNKNRKNLDEASYTGLSGELGSFKSRLDGIKNHYSQWDNAGDYNAAMKQAEEDAARWAELTGGYDPTKNQAEGKAGWDDYAATRERHIQQAEAKTEPETDDGYSWEQFWDDLGRWMGPGVNPDTSLPVHVDVGLASKEAQDNDAQMRAPKDNWTDEQRETFGYLWNTQRQKAYDYAYAINNMLNVQAENAKIEEIQAGATDNFLSGAAHTAGALLTSPLGLADYMEALIAAGAVDQIPLADGEITPFEYSQAVTGGISQHLNEKSGVLDEDIPVIGGKGLGDVYGLGTSIAQSALSAYSGGSGQALVTFFGSSAAAGVDDALSRGATNEQAVAYGTLSGLAEALAEQIGVDNLLRIGASATMREVVWNIVKQGVAEGLEEGATTLMNNFADQLVMQDKSQFHILVKQYMDRGMSEGDAKKQAWVDMANDMAFDMLGGFVSGAVHAGPQTTYQTLYSNINAKANYGEFQNELVGEALEIDPGNAFAQKMQGRLDSGKNLSGSQLNKLVQQNERAMSEQDMASIQSAETQEKAETLAEVEGKTLNTANAVSNTNKADSNAGNAVSNTANTDSNTENDGYAISDDGKTRLVSTGEEVSVEKIVEIADDGMKLQLSDGRTVAADDVVHGSEDDAVLYDAVMSLGTDAETANVLLQTYHEDNGGVSASDYAFGIAEAFQYGNHNIPAVELAENAYAKKLTDTQRNSAYALGQRYGSKTTESAQVKASRARMHANYKKTVGAGKVQAVDGNKVVDLKSYVEMKGKKLSDVQETSVRTMEKLSAMLNVDFYVFESYEKDGRMVYVDESGVERPAPNGMYTSDGKIYVDLNAGNTGKGTMLFTIAHELTHFIKDWSPENFKIFADYLMEQYNDQGVSVSELVNNQIKKAEKNGRKLSFDAAYEEVVADSMESMLTDGNVVQMMADFKQKDKTLWQKISDWFRNLVEEMKALMDAYKGYKPDSVEGKLVADMEEIIPVLECFYTSALLDASENYQAARTLDSFSGDYKESHNGMKHSDRASIDVSALKEQQLAIINENNRMADDYHVGIRNVADIRTFEEAMQDDESFVYGDFELEDAEKALATGKVTVYSSKPIKQGGFVSTSYNMAKDYAGSGRVYSKTVALTDVAWINGDEGQYAKVNGHAGAVKLSDRDSNGNQLSEAQQEFFKDSKVRDESGNLLVVYHGSKNSGFNVFRYSKDVQTGTDHGEAYYFTSDRQKASGYSYDVTKDARVEQYKKEREVLKNRYLETHAEEDKRAFLDYKLDGKKLSDLVNDEEYLTEGGEVKEVFLNLTNPLVADAGGKYYYEVYSEYFAEARNNGNDGIIVKNVIDNPRGEHRPIDTYIAFHPEQIKRIDNRKPTSNADIRFSDRSYAAQLDADYMEAVESGDTELIQMFVDEAAKAAGYNIKAYHGTRNSFNIFMTTWPGAIEGTESIYLSADRSTAASYGHKVMPLYAKVDNLYTFDGGGKAANYMEVGDKLTKAQIESIDSVWDRRTKERVSTDQVAYAIHKEGKYDGVAFENVADSYYDDHLTTVYAVFNSNQVKSADPIVYDDDGNVVPLSERFNPDNDDVRFSDRDPSAPQVEKALEKENAKLKDDVARLKELLKLQKTVTGGTKFTRSSVEKVARQLKKNAGAKGDTNELVNLLNTFYEGVATGNELTWETVKEMALPAAEWLQSNVVLGQERSEYATEILQNLRTSRITLDETQKEEAAYKYGSYNDFRKATMGTVIVANDGVPLDIQWQEWSSMYPDVFDADISASDMPAALMEAVQSLRNTDLSKAEYAYYSDMILQGLVEQVYDSYWRVSTLRTLADQHQRKVNDLKSKHYTQMETLKESNAQKINALKAKHSAQMATLRETKNARIDQLKQEHREHTERIKQDYKVRAEKKQKALIEKHKEDRKQAAANWKESAAVKKNRAVVEKRVKALMHMLANPTKDEHVPTALQQPLQEFLESIDFSSKTQSKGNGATIRDVAYTRALMDVRDAVAAQRNAMDGAEDGVFALDVPEGFLADIDKHIKAVNDATKGLDLTTNRVYDMSSAELADLAYILGIINKTIRDIDKLHMAGSKARVSELSNNTISEMAHRKPVKSEDGGKAMWANYTPYHAFRRMGTAAQQIFKGLMQGQAKLAQTINKVIEFAQKTYSTKEVNAWESKRYTIKLESGENIQMTPAQIMSFYCLSKREHAKGHMNGGGIRIGTIKYDTKDAARNRTKELVQKTHYLLTDKDIAEINNKLTDRQREVADALQQYMQTVGGKLNNEISMARWDYMAATEDYYFPIKTDDATRDAKSPEQDRTNLWALLNKSFTKGLTPGANNALVVESIFDVFADHMSEVAEYNAFALPLVDAMKWFNYREQIKLDGTHVKHIGVRKSIEDALGNAATRYFTDLMTDINSSQKAGRHENFLGKILSRSKIASVGWNLRVAIQQPTAILRASLILDMPSLAKGSLRIGTKKLVQEMQQYSGIALWKSLGYYDLNVSRSVREQIKGDTTVLDKFNEAGMWLPGKMDEWTWARIWAATKAKVAREQKLSGEALLKATAERFEDVVYQTQVADSVLTRSSIMRSKSQLMKEATAFMAEPTVSYNILLSAFQDYDSGHTPWGKAKRGLMIGFYGYALSALANALASSLMDAWRDDDEYEEFLEKYKQALLGEGFWDGNLISELNPLEKVVFVRDILSAIKGYTTSTSYGDLIDGTIGLIDSVQRYMQGKGSLTDYGMLYQVLQVIGTGTGIGLSNISRETVGIWNNTIGRMHPDKMIYRYEEKPSAKIRNAYNAGALTADEAMQALVENDVAKSKDDAYWTIQGWDNGADYSKYDAIEEAVKNGKSIDAAMNELTSHGQTQKQVISHIKSKIGDWYKGTDKEPASITKQQAISMLKKYTDMSTDEITATVNEWSCKVVTGIDYGDIKEEFMAGNITAQRAREMYMRYGGMAETDVDNKIRAYQWMKRNPKYDLSESQVLSYIKPIEAIGQSIEDTGISPNTFVEYGELRSKCKGTDANGDGRADTNTVKNQVLDVINNLPITVAQKDALYYLNGWAKSKLYQAPWH